MINIIFWTIHGLLIMATLASLGASRVKFARAKDMAERQNVMLGSEWVDRIHVLHKKYKNARIAFFFFVTLTVIEALILYLK